MAQETKTMMLTAAQRQAKICSVFANPKRILILWALSDQEQAVTAIAREIDASLQSTSQHLGLMKSAGIVKARRDGQTIYYRIAGDFNEVGCAVFRRGEENN